ncbi:UDP-2,4-diacetamido-2,4,6-trideoxy-beta-L-altropyranose hydrolase [Spirosoma areae]
MNKLLFRADGNAEIGLGHVMRCLALANMLKGSFSMRFALVEPAPEVCSLLNEQGVSVSKLTDSDSRAGFLSLIEPDELVVLDGYSFDALYQEEIRSHARKLIYIDDLSRAYQVADVVINHAGGVSETAYKAAAYTQFCLGPHYALLRPEFLRPSLPATGPSQAGPIFVSMGGGDLFNTSLQVLEAIQEAGISLPVHVVLGPFHPDRAAIDAFQKQLPNLAILQNLTARQMVDEIQQCSLAITACSTIAYEVCAVNRPLIAVVTADNQARLAQFLSEEKLAISVNFPRLLSRLSPSMELQTALKLEIMLFQFSSDTVTETLVNQRRFFDGRSPERFRALFRQLSA